MSEDLIGSVNQFLKSNPDKLDFDHFIGDMNGVFRGKRVNLDKLAQGL